MKNLAFIGPVALLVIWALVSAFNLIDVFFLPSPWTTINELWNLLYSKSIFPDVYATLYRITVAFGLSVIIGVPIGILLGSSEKIYRSVEFLIDFFRSTAPLALFPLFLIIFGISDASKIAVSVFTASILIIFNVAYGIIHAKRTRRLAAQIMGATKAQIFIHIMIWEGLPQTFTGLRTALSWIMAVIVATEMFVGSSTGLGHKIIDFQITYNLPGVYATILLTGFIGYLLNLLFVIIEKRFLHWSTR